MVVTLATVNSYSLSLGLSPDAWEHVVLKNNVGAQRGVRP